MWTTSNKLNKLNEIIQTHIKRRNNTRGPIRHRSDRPERYACFDGPSTTTGRLSHALSPTCTRRQRCYDETSIWIHPRDCGNVQMIKLCILNSNTFFIVHIVHLYHFSRQLFLTTIISRVHEQQLWKKPFWKIAF